MVKSKRDELLSQARALYAEGSTKSVIAVALEVAPRTIRRWARQDAEAGRPWTRDRGVLPVKASPPEPAFADRLYRKLQDRLADLIDKESKDAEDPKLEDRMLKLCKVLDYLQGDRENLAQQLVALKRFASFCVRNLTEEEMGPVRKAIRLFLEKEREEHS